MGGRRKQAGGSFMQRPPKNNKTTKKPYVPGYAFGADFLLSMIFVAALYSSLSSSIVIPGSLLAISCASICLCSAVGALFLLLMTAPPVSSRGGGAGKSGGYLSCIPTRIYDKHTKKDSAWEQSPGIPLWYEKRPVFRGVFILLCSGRKKTRGIFSPLRAASLPSHYPMRNFHNGHLTAGHWRTSLLLPPQQSKHLRRIAVFLVNFSSMAICSFLGTLPPGYEPGGGMLTSSSGDCTSSRFSPLLPGSSPRRGMQRFPRPSYPGEDGRDKQQHTLRRSD